MRSSVLVELCQQFAWTGGPAFGLLDGAYKAGAPFFAKFAKGGSRECRRKFVAPGCVVTNPIVGCSIAAHPCKKRKDGAPSVGMAHTENHERWATRPAYVVVVNPARNSRREIRMLLLRHSVELAHAILQQIQWLPVIHQGSLPGSLCSRRAATVCSLFTWTIRVATIQPIKSPANPCRQ